MYERYGQTAHVIKCKFEIKLLNCLDIRMSDLWKYQIPNFHRSFGIEFTFD